ncbi:winged helix-turn-helix transcriptional regulator [Propionibacteriaceae bacterium Y1685]|uniref:winged helix-turn-helix transcriptional regulator n=1 Tax=Microlunatus sp. Y1700 TaxID=3418487 RepID=UPI003B7D2533
MLGRTYDRENCSAARTLELVGERWSLLIIRNAQFASMTRFSDFQRRLGIAPNILTSRLNDFVANGIMAVDQQTYRLTDKGRELAEIVVALTGWGDRWAAPEGPPIVYAHTGCGGTVTMRAHCGRCNNEPPMVDVVATPGPGANAVQRERLDPGQGKI